MLFHFHANQSHFHKNGFALRLTLEKRHKRTRKWPITKSRLYTRKKMQNFQKPGIFLVNNVVVVLIKAISYYRGFARQPCCMAETIVFPMGITVLCNAKHFHCSCHATWLPCKTSICIARRDCAQFSRH